MIKIRNKILIILAVGLISIAEISHANSSSKEQGWVNRMAHNIENSIDNIVSHISNALFDSPEEIKAQLRKQCHEEINFFIKQREGLSCHIQVFDKYTRGGQLNKIQTYPSESAFLRISSGIIFGNKRRKQCEELEEFLDDEFESRVKYFWDKKDGKQSITISDIMPNDQNFPPPRCATDFKLPIGTEPTVSPQPRSKSSGAIR